MQTFWIITAAFHKKTSKNHNWLPCQNRDYTNPSTTPNGKATPKKSKWHQKDRICMYNLCNKKSGKQRRHWTRTVNNNNILGRIVCLRRRCCSWMRGIYGGRRVRADSFHLMRPILLVWCRGRQGLLEKQISPLWSKKNTILVKLVSIVRQGSQAARTEFTGNRCSVGKKTTQVTMIMVVGCNGRHNTR